MNNKKPKGQPSSGLKSFEYVMSQPRPQVEYKLRLPCVFVNNLKTQLILYNTQMSHPGECQLPANSFGKLRSGTNWNHKSSSYSKPNHHKPLVLICSQSSFGSLSCSILLTQSIHPMTVDLILWEIPVGELYNVSKGVIGLNEPYIYLFPLNQGQQHEWNVFSLISSPMPVDNMDWRNI